MVIILGSIRIPNKTQVDSQDARNGSDVDLLINSLLRIIYHMKLLGVPWIIVN